jgi:hypothetical protein
MSLNRPQFNRDEVFLASDELAQHVQRSLDETHRELAWLRALLISAAFLLLSIVNFLILSEEVRDIAIGLSTIVTITFLLFTLFHRFVDYPARMVNLVSFCEFCVLQIDGIAFSLATDNLMSGFGVYLMIVAAGIFMTTGRSLTITATMLLVTWMGAVMFQEGTLELSREPLMLVAALFGAYFFFYMRLQAARRLSEHQLMEQKYKESLEYALEHIETLSGLLPICASCKSIRTEDNKWTELEVYVRDRSDVEFTHSVCPSCHDVLYPGIPRRE